MITVDPAVVAAILAVGGVGVVGLTDMLKRLFKVGGIYAYLINLGVSVAATAFILATSGVFTVPALVVYTIVVFLEANGVYKTINKPAPTP